MQINSDEGDSLPKWNVDRDTGQLKFGKDVVNITRKTKSLLKSRMPSVRELQDIANQLNEKPQKHTFFKVKLADFDISLNWNESEQKVVPHAAVRMRKFEEKVKLQKIVFHTSKEAMDVLFNQNRRCVCYPSDKPGIYIAAIKEDNSISHIECDKCELLKFIEAPNITEQEVANALENREFESHWSVYKNLDEAEIAAKDKTFVLLESGLQDKEYMVVFPDSTSREGKILHVLVNKTEFRKIARDWKVLAYLKERAVTQMAEERVRASGRWCASTIEAKEALKNNPELQYVVHQLGDQYILSVPVGNQFVEIVTTRVEFLSFFDKEHPPSQVKSHFIEIIIKKQLGAKWVDNVDQVQKALRYSPELVVRESFSGTHFVVYLGIDKEIRIVKNDFYQILMTPKISDNDVILHLRLYDRHQEFEYHPETYTYTLIDRGNKANFTSKELSQLLNDQISNKWLQELIKLKSEGAWWNTKKEAQTALSTLLNKTYAIVQGRESDIGHTVVFKLGRDIAEIEIGKDILRDIILHARSPEDIHLRVLEKYFDFKWQRDGMYMPAWQNSSSIKVAVKQSGSDKYPITFRMKDGTLCTREVASRSLFTFLRDDPLANSLIERLQHIETLLDSCVQSHQDIIKVSKSENLLGQLQIKSAVVGITVNDTLDSFAVFIQDPASSKGIAVKNTKGLKDLENIIDQIFELKELIDARPRICAAGMQKALDLLSQLKTNPYIGQPGQKPDIKYLKPGSIGCVPSYHQDCLILFMEDPAEQNGLYTMQVDLSEMYEDEFVKYMGIKVGDMISRQDIMHEEFFTEATKKHVQIKPPNVASDEVKGVSLAELMQMFDSINFTDPKIPGYKDPSRIMNDDKYIGVEDAKAGLANYISRITNRDPKYYGTPQSSIEASQQYYEKLEAMAKSSIVHLRDMQSENPSAFVECILELSIAGKHCGTRFVNATDYIYRLSSNQISEANGVEEAMYQILDNLKLGVVDAFIAQVAARSGDHIDPNHLRNYVYTVIQTLGIALPGQDLIGIEDEYERLATNAIELAYPNSGTILPVKQFFQSQFAPNVLVDRVQEACLERLKKDSEFESLLIGYFTGKIELKIDLAAELYKVGTPEYENEIKKIAEENHCSMEVINKLKQEQDAFKEEQRSVAGDKNKSSQVTKEHALKREKIMSDDLAARGWLYFDVNSDFKKMHRFSYEAAACILEQMGLIQNIKRNLQDQGLWAESMEEAAFRLETNPEVEYIVHQSKTDPDSYSVSILNLENKVTIIQVTKKIFTGLVEAGREIRSTLLQGK